MWQKIKWLLWEKRQVKISNRKALERLFREGEERAISPASLKAPADVAGKFKTASPCGMKG
jgi:hypothetical protein